MMGFKRLMVSYLFHENRPHTITEMNDNINMDSFYVVFNKSQEQLKKIVLFNQSQYLILKKQIAHLLCLLICRSIGDLKKLHYG